MTLSFKTEINGKPTYFPEKIWAVMPLESWAYINEVRRNKNKRAYKQLSKMLDNYIYLMNRNLIKPKIHTIRRDPNHRWKAGNKIHFVINNRKPDRLQFASVIKCTGTQEIRLYPDIKRILVESPDKTSINELSEVGAYILATNDGFDSIEDFWNYFDKPFNGKIIHWTDNRY